MRSLAVAAVNDFAESLAANRPRLPFAISLSSRSSPAPRSARCRTSQTLRQVSNVERLALLISRPHRGTRAAPRYRLSVAWWREGQVIKGIPLPVCPPALRDSGDGVTIGIPSRTRRRTPLQAILAPVFARRLGPIAASIRYGRPPHIAPSAERTRVCRATSRQKFMSYGASAAERRAATRTRDGPSNSVSHALQQTTRA
jgi:hypothetical protein